mgnify:CR=1 FL=1
MTVYSINKRVFEQASQTTAGTKSSGGAADQFLAALNQAESKVNVSSTATVSTSADQAFKQVFARQDDATRQTTKTEDKSKRTEAKSQDRDDKANAVRDTKQTDDTQARPDAKEATKDAKDDGDDTPKANDDAKAAPADDDDQPVIAAQDDEAAAEIVAAVVEVQQQVVEATPKAAENNAPQVVAAAAPEKIADAGTKPQQGSQNNQPVADAAADTNAAPVVDASADDQNAPKAQAHQAATDDAAKAQADDLAASLDDTGAQVNVAVTVKTETPRPAQPTVGTAEVLLTQDVDGVQVQPTNSGNGGQSGNQAQANAGNAQQTAAQAQGAQQAEQPVDAKPFAAILAAAQAETASQPQAAGGGAGQSTQAVAGLGGAAGTAGAAKSAAAQTAQAARPQQLPEAKEIIDQVKVQIAKQGANGDTIKVQLKPVEMGSIEVKLDVAKDGSVSGVVTADNKDTLAMLKNDSRTLEKALSDAGFKTDAGSLTFNLRGDGQQQTGQDQNSGRRSRRAMAALNGLDATQSGALAAQAQARSAGGRSGVDIQV